MAKVVLPPRLSAYYRKQKLIHIRYGDCWPLHYQQEDRYRHEEWPEIHRKKANKYDKKAAAFAKMGWMSMPPTGEDSEYESDDPFNHILYKAVNGEEANQWWNENFVWQANQITNKVKTISAFLENDALVAASKADHAGTAYVAPRASSSWSSMHGHALFSAEQPVAAIPTGKVKPGGKGGGGGGKPPAPQVAPELGVKRKAHSTTNHEISKGYNHGHCEHHVADGPS